MFKMPTAVTVILVAGLMVGPACSSSGLKSRAGDAGVGSGGQVGNSTISGITGGSGGTIGPSGAGGSGVGGTAGMIGPGGTGGVNTGGTGGQGGAAGASTGAAGAGGIYGADAGGRMSASDAGRSNGNSGTGGQGDATDSPLSQGGMCGAIPGCNPGDQQVGFAPGSEYTDLSDCPAERECYSLGDNCGSILCVLPRVCIATILYHAILAIHRYRSGISLAWGTPVRVMRASCVRKPLYADLGQMPVWMRVASRNLIAVLRVWALLTPNRVFPAKF